MALNIPKIIYLYIPPINGTKQQKKHIVIIFFPYIFFLLSPIEKCFDTSYSEKEKPMRYYILVTSKQKRGKQMFKKSISLALASMIVLSSIPVSYASNINNYQSGTEVVYQAANEEAWILTIPARLSQNSEGTVALTGAWSSEYINIGRN